MKFRWISAIGLGALVVPLSVVAGTHALADAVGRELGAALAPEVSWMQAKPVEHSVELAAEAPESLVSDVMPEPAQASVPREKRRVRAAAAPRALAVRVSSRQVLALAEQRAMPSAVPVGATARHPAGLRLVGVSALGVGMRDGDILTRVGGTPVQSVSAVASLVISARGRAATEVSAEFWRAGVRGALVVEQPYLVTPAQTSAAVAHGSRAP